MSSTTSASNAASTRLSKVKKATANALLGCPTSAELDAYDTIAACCSQHLHLGCSDDEQMWLDYSFNDASKIIPLMNDKDKEGELSKIVKQAYSLLSAQFKLFYLAAADTNAAPLSPSTLYVEYDFVAHWRKIKVAATPQATAAGGGASGGTEGEQQKSPEATPPTLKTWTAEEFLAAAKPCLEGLKCMGAVSAVAGLWLTYVPSSSNIITLEESSTTSSPTGHFPQALFDMLDDGAQKGAVKLAAGHQLEEMCDVWESEAAKHFLLLSEAESILKNGDQLNSTNANRRTSQDKLNSLIVKLTGVRKKSGGKKAGSQEKEQDKVILVEIKLNTNIIFALFQLELRVAVYVAHRRVKHADPNLALHDVVALAGLYVQESQRDDVMEILCQYPGLVLLHQLQASKRFLVITSKDGLSATSGNQITLADIHSATGGVLGQQSPPTEAPVTTAATPAWMLELEIDDEDRAVLVKEKITENVFLVLKEGDLKEIGFCFGTRRTLMMEIEKRVEKKKQNVVKAGEEQ